MNTFVNVLTLCDKNNTKETCCSKDIFINSLEETIQSVADKSVMSIKEILIVES